MARTVRHDPSPARVALVNRGGKGFHGGSKRAMRKRDRKAARRELRASY